ncbi:MAG: TatD family deoxyribonuclease [Actinomycetota bacterium]|nr:MAG: TatD family deoxyribonuclease [Actinomycetota bacterium]
MWIDTHCHIHTEDDPLELARDSFKAAVDALICIGTDVLSSQKAVGVASTIERAIRGGATDLPRCYSTIGLHPHDASNPGMTGLDGIAHLARLNAPQRTGNLVAIGECGLDYFYEYSPKHNQQLAFSRQIELAKENDLTLVIHTRDAWDDTFSILLESGLPNRTVFHCFTGDTALASRALDLGAYLSFSGMVTFRNAENIREAARFTPLDRLLIETDSPYLAPVPHRGKTNTPAFVGLVGEFIAKVKDLSFDEFSDATVAAANECFSLK